MTEKEKRRIGRPMKKSARGEKRASLGLKVRVAVKKQIDEAAKDSGRTQSQEAEALIERCLTYDVMLKAMNQTIAVKTVIISPIPATSNAARLT